LGNSYEILNANFLDQKTYIKFHGMDDG
jgi:hypothetical protein